MDTTIVRNDPTSREKQCLRVVITEATSYVARSLAYRILSDKIFGDDQQIVLYFYDSGGLHQQLESVAFEITSSASNLLTDILYSTDVSQAFHEADFVFLIGKARDYNFAKMPELIDDPFCIDSLLETKNTAIALEKYAKKTVKVITLENTSMKLISEYAPSIPPENITGVTLVYQNLAASAIAKKTNRLPSHVRNLIIWGCNSRSLFPYCEYATFLDGKSVTREICDDDWFKKNLPKMVKGVVRKCHYRISEVLALAEHCKNLVQGTPPNEWINMNVISDGSYGVTPGYYFSFPVYCRDGNWQIVQGLYVEDYCKRIIRELHVSLDEQFKIALKICRRGSTSRNESKKSIRKSILKLHNPETSNTPVETNKN